MISVAGSAAAIPDAAIVNAEAKAPAATSAPARTVFLPEQLTLRRTVPVVRRSGDPRVSRGGVYQRFRSVFGKSPGFE
ncbi:hypothetical protein JMUB6875_43480 [Nocardia sp. JMUB6875]